MLEKKKIGPIINGDFVDPCQFSQFIIKRFKLRSTTARNLRTQWSNPLVAFQ